MFENYLACALRNLARHRLHTAITTLSLAVGFTAAIMAALLWRHETTYDRFWPNADRIYLVAQWTWGSGPAAPRAGVPQTSDHAASGLADHLRQSLGQAQAVGRLSAQTVGLSRGDVASPEAVRWADPNIFEIFKPKVLAGDLSTALNAPNSIVLTESLARKYFGDAPPLGQTLSLTYLSQEGPAKLPGQVTAVIADIPADSHLVLTGLISGVTAVSPLNDPNQDAYTYILARAETSPAALQEGLDAVSGQPIKPGDLQRRLDFKLLTLPQVYMKPANYGWVGGSRSTNEGMKAGNRHGLVVSASLAGLILAVAAINFVTLMTARGAGRAVEVGVRKACGARRRDLVVQFIGEALLHSAAALVIGLAAVELLAPLASAVMGHPVGLHYPRDLGLLAACAGAALLIGAMAGLYPALALSAYRPAAVLKGGRAKTPGSARLRQVLVTAQFLPLAILAVGAIDFSLLSHNRTETARHMLAGDPLLISEDCTPGLKAELQALPGVASVNCANISDWHFGADAMGLWIGGDEVEAIARNGRTLHLDGGQVEPETLRFHFEKTLAGRLLSDGETGEVVINESAARELGYTRPADAVGQTLSWRQLDGVDVAQLAGAFTTKAPMRISTIIGLAADRGRPGFEFTVFAPPGPSISSPPIRGLGMRLTGENVPATLAEIDRAWAATGAARPINRIFYSEKIADEAAGEKRALGLVTTWMVVGLIVASLGLFGLAAFLAEQRTKEIGVRKALGAGRPALLRMLLFQFAGPVLIANLIAYPLVSAFQKLQQAGLPAASRIYAGPEVFAAVLAASLLIAMAATSAHAWRVTGARPVTALRHE